METNVWLGDWINKIKQEAKGSYPRESFMMSFYMASENLYGLPERANTYKLNVTKKYEPYRLYALDKFPHEEFDDQSLYSGIPYIMGHSEKSHDEAVMWINGADTYVDIFEDIVGGNSNGRIANFISEGGMLEFFIIAATSPKRLQKLLATVTGFPALPPFFSLGFHYSKWEDTSAARIIEYNEKFE
jgi:mannosyl-oligosaccharide alpha-1,3-glucosidase